MADGMVFTGGDYVALLSRYIGETVTIFTNSGGQSGAGFTGIILSVNDVFVRLVTQVGPAPSCSLGNACGGLSFAYGKRAYRGGFGGGYWGSGSLGSIGAASSSGWGAEPVYTVGAVTNIPVADIVSFVHNAV